MSDPGQLRPVVIRMLDGRVGSTLMMQLLGTAPEVVFDRVYPYENSYLTYLTRLTSRIDAPRPKGAPGARMHDFVYGDASHVGSLPFEPVGLDCKALAIASLASLWRNFSQATAATAGHPGRLYAEKFWGDIDTLIEAGLDPFVIDLVRDPRDVVASVRAFSIKKGREMFENGAAETDADRLSKTVIGMSMRFATFATDLPVERLVIRYEDLVADLPSVAAQLSQSLSLKLDVTTALQPQSHTSAHVTSGSATSSVGRWVADLSPHDIEVIETRLGDRMVALGYVLSTDPIDNPSQHQSPGRITGRARGEQPQGAVAQSS